MSNRGELLLDCGRIPLRRDILPAFLTMAVMIPAMATAGALIAPDYADAIVVIAVGHGLLFGLMFTWFAWRRRVRVWERGIESQAGFHRWGSIVVIELYGGDSMSIVTQRLMRFGMRESVQESLVPKGTFHELADALQKRVPQKVRVLR